ncbi:hypothetical protein CHLNCDRAFT_59105 [Chlorella variabilis]|uniref:ATP-dependent RNA helicase n=1 Tax=Chlorella variabilis TaxID=554065 RepID=E1ZQR5_CHLVA|nr:hypothetical protein CHLNCDRAFT_59105 [Chlorella variabilis]EFN51763.1 hypothetical protein CHLNCDRAFT_59105 [Chlorella variabilis]|eukprot:XP_005843865.1 hypothetical protein CHLNCDRAFT_59105 [Chlorella variabilis]
MRNPVRVNVAVTFAQPKGTNRKAPQPGPVVQSVGRRTPSTLQIQYVVCEASQKMPQLVAFLQEHKTQKVIVYFLTCACVDFASVVLPRLPQCKALCISALHGKMKQAVRATTLAAFAAAPAGVLLCTDVAARGLDIPDVQWIVQFDPPQDPSAFVHRVGRTARMGRSGNAVVYLFPHETSYVEFLKVRNIPLQQAALARALPDVQPIVQRQAETDRLVMEAGTKAFLSYMRAYKEHHCRFIFRLQVGWQGCQCAITLPVRPGREVRFKDKAREKQRQAALKQRLRQRREAAAQPEQQHKAPLKPEVHLPAAKRRKLQDKEDLDELQRDYSLMRRLKKGKISVAEFELETDPQEGL